MNPSAASATMKELITKDKVNLVLGGLSSAVGLGMSEVSKQEKVVYISTIPKTIQMTTDKLHKHVFRISANTDQEGLDDGACSPGSTSCRRSAIWSSTMPMVTISRPAS